VHVGFGEDVTAHELAHQWFQGVIASDEVRHPMLDEGLTQWATADLLRVQYGDASGFDFPGLSVDFYELMRAWTLSRAEPPAPGEPATAFREGEYGRSVYARTALVLETMARLYGRTRLERAIGRYARAMRFRHPTPEDLFAAFADEYGEHVVSSILRPALMEGKRADVALALVPSTSEGGGVRASRTGDLPVDLDVALLADDAPPIAAVFPGAAREHVFDHPASIDRAMIDPRRRNLLDARRADNVADAAPPVRGALVRVIHAVQALLSLVGP
jgi:hypothetical protein